MLLAYAQDGTAEDVLPETWAPRTPHSLISRAAVVGQFPAIRDAGYAIDNEESTPGFRCVAAPILTRGGIAIAAISMTTVSSRTPMTELKAMGMQAAETAAAIARALGH